MAADETTVINLMDAVDDYWHTMSSISTTHRLAEGRLALEKAINAALAAARAEGVREERARCVALAERVLTNAEANRGEDHDTYHEGAEDAAREILDEISRVAALEVGDVS